VACPDEDLGEALPASAVGSTLEEQNDFGGSCGGLEAPEATFLWSAPAPGTYRIDTIGSTFDTVLYVLQGTCEGPELACNDDTDEGVHSSVNVDLAAGELVTIVVDGFGIERGEYRVLVTAAGTTCPDGDLGMEVPVSTSASTAGAQDVFSASCGGFNAPERTYLWTAPMAGEYTFDTSGSAFDTVLYVLEGICSGGELACDDDSGPGSTSTAALALGGGQMVTVVVDGAEDEGSFGLNISLVAGSCPDADLGSGSAVAAGSTVGAGNTMTGSCGGGSAPDVSYSWTAPATATYFFETWAVFDTVLYLRDGGCDGPEIGCSDYASGSQNRARLITDLIAGQTVVATVDGKGTASGDFELTIYELQCPDEDLGSAFPYETTGSTEWATDTLEGSCQVESSPDVAFEWTAPAAGTYTIDTFGSTYDTVLFVLDGTCGGPELGCDDDTFQTQSQVVVSLAAGQTVVIVVDGYGGSVGDFVLRIN
jgi:hypothetical protein